MTRWWATAADGRRSTGICVVSVLTLLLVLATAAPLTACSGQTTDEGAAETVLRTSRLAGYLAAEVGADRSEAVVALRLPSANSAADIELAWQTGMAILSEAYPKARSYRVVVGTEDVALLSVTARRRDAREAVEQDDPAALKAAATFRLLAHVSDQGELVPAGGVGTQTRESELDSANRATGLTTPSGPTVKDAGALKDAWRRGYEAAPGVATPSEGGEAAARYAADRIERALSGASVDGATALEGLVPGLVAGQDAWLLRQWAATAEAVAAEEALPSVLALTAAATREVGDGVRRNGGPGKYGRQQDGSVLEFERVDDLDVAGTVDGTGVVPATLARYGVPRDARIGLMWRPNDSSPLVFAGADEWRAFRAPDGAVYWMAGERGDVALTETSLRGWAYETPSATLVDAKDVTREYGTYPLWGNR